MAYTFNDLIDIMKRLRSPDGCPWDKEQNINSLLPYLIEESCEYIDAAQANDKVHMCEELGDVLLQVVFHAQVASEQGDFSISEVIESICEKMIRRHPHVFGDATAEDANAVLRQWERIKASEKNNIGMAEKSAMDKVSKSLPPLARAQELQRRAAKVGFDWNSEAPVFEKVLEEITEFREEMQAEIKNKEKIEEEFGDILFSFVNWARHIGLNASTALMRANSKFDRRFREVEKLAEGQDMKSMGLEKLDALWDQVKKEER
jgi:tetrapyrrole methylase family protein / MazG family protein